MAYLLLITFASVSGILVKGCTNTGIADCFRQHMHSLQNFANKINSPEILKRLNAKDTVEEYCSSMKSLRPCLEDVKMKCLITNRITFTIDVLTAPSKFLCSEGKQDFIDHFQCAILDHIQNQTSFEICQNYMKELFESVIESQIGSSNNDGKICRAANKTVMCMEEEANKLCSDEATKVMRAKMEAAIQPLKKNISCDNNTIVRVHGCNKDGFSKCLLQSSIPNFVRKLKSINNYKILNTEKIVDEYCSIIREPSHCLEDIKTTCHSTNSVSLNIDTVLSADTFLCTVGKQGFIKNFKCVVVDILFGRGLHSCVKNHMTELKANIILAETGGSGMSREISENICRYVFIR
ncbi:uncharacterized protein LOC134242402 [Saccostrea cucullata]|uniref:uncharacterized protein LOC134242402 n=1 Tax=Saccostrea cuccullata TaxID=36930 RepID=UPI002ED01338